MLRRRGVLLRLNMVLRQLLRIPHGKALLGNRLGQGYRIRRRNQGSRVPRRQAAISQHVAHRIRKLQQAQAVGDVASALADDLTEIVLGIAMFGDQLLVTQCFFERIEIRALDVFDNGQLERGSIVNITNNYRDLNQTRQLRGAPAAFAGNDLIAIHADGTHDDRLHYAMLAN